jgi:orotate phosphoribosyltransferase-like protein
VKVEDDAWHSHKFTTSKNKNKVSVQNIQTTHKNINERIINIKRKKNNPVLSSVLRSRKNQFSDFL